MKILHLILILVSTSYCFGQSGDYCGKKKKLKNLEIKKQFPYNETELIKLVSFKYDYPEIQSDTGDIEVPDYQPEIPKTSGKLDLTKMFETKTLDSKLTEKLLDILVNYDNEDRQSEVAFCYEPRNGIVFLDKEDNVIGYVEICFDCLRYKVVPNSMNVTRFCTEKFDALKNIFKEVGITYGTIHSGD
jgi:hypothetical protein